MADLMRAVITVEIERAELARRFRRLVEEILEGGGRLEPEDSLENFWLERVKEMAVVVNELARYDRTYAPSLTVRLEVDGKDVPIR